jgi:hypothetical protein
MAISVQNSRKAKDSDDSIVDFLCDTESDVAALPTQRRKRGWCVASTGSTATVITPQSGRSNRRMLAPNGEWIDSPHSVVIDCGTPSTH